MSSQQFIGITKEEAVHHDAHRAETTHQTLSTPGPLTSKSKYCIICKCNNHNTNECRNHGKKFCNICKKPNHKDKDCWYRKGKRKRDGQLSQRGKKKQKTKATNIVMNKGESMQVEEQVEEEVAFMMEEDRDILMSPSDEGQYLNFSNNNVNNTDGIDEPLDYYNWLADTVTTSHITNQR